MTIKNKEKYHGQVIKQVRGIVSVFDLFFEKEKFDNIIEIGSGNGAFSLYFASKAKDMNCSFTTIDIRPVSSKIKKELVELGADVLTCDINKNSFIEDIIREKGRCLILNDGGLKVPQFIRFSKLIKKEDIMLTHDYYKNRESEAGIIIMEDVKKYIKKNKLQVINEKMFDDYLWLCVIKV